MSVEGMGNRFSSVNTNSVNNTNSIGNISNTKSVEKTPVAEKNPSLNLDNKVSFSAIGKKDFAKELTFVSNSNNKSLE